MTTKTTPGPWTTSETAFNSAGDVLDDLERLLYAGGEHNFTITKVVAPDPRPETMPSWSNGNVVVAFLGNGPTAPANARLIAAAPEMLELLREMAPMCEAMGPARATGAGNVVWFSPDGDDSKDLHKSTCEAVVALLARIDGGGE